MFKRGNSDRLLMKNWWPIHILPPRVLDYG